MVTVGEDTGGVDVEVASATDVPPACGECGCGVTDGDCDEYDGPIAQARSLLEAEMRWAMLAEDMAARYALGAP